MDPFEEFGIGEKKAEQHRRSATEKEVCLENADDYENWTLEMNKLFCVFMVSRLNLYFELEELCYLTHWSDLLV